MLLSILSPACQPCCTDFWLFNKVSGLPAAMRIRTFAQELKSEKGGFWKEQGNPEQYARFSMALHQVTVTHSVWHHPICILAICRSAMLLRTATSMPLDAWTRAEHEVPVGSAPFQCRVLCSATAPFSTQSCSH